MRKGNKLSYWSRGFLESGNKRFRQQLRSGVSRDYLMYSYPEIYIRSWRTALIVY